MTEAGEKIKNQETENKVQESLFIEPKAVEAVETVKTSTSVTPKEPRKLKKGEFVEAVGRRKRATARVRIFGASATASVRSNGFEINGKTAKEYFQEWQYNVAIEPLIKASLLDTFSMTVKVNGGGVTGQAEATRMGLARAIVALEQTFKAKMRRAGYLTRDSREKERKKYGLKKARRAPQFSKR